MPLPIEDYGLIGNLRTAALVGRNGSIDWLCAPRFDDAACFCALLGGEHNGRWLIAPERALRRTARRYRGDSLVLETTFTTASGSARVVDFMPPYGERTDVVRIVEGVRGRVAMRMELVLRFGYGNIIPWVRRAEGGLLATAGPLSAHIRSQVATHGKDFRTVARFVVAAGQRLPFVITFFPSHLPMPLPVDPYAAQEATLRFWDRWCSQCTVAGPWRGLVMRSLITLKGLTHAPTGGMVAAATTSLPERAGGDRNWDYRYCWVRDSTFTLYALLLAGYRDEAAAWRGWLLRAAAGHPGDLKILYAVDGSRVSWEYELPWLSGYARSKPVRVGNAASDQVQIDVYGELVDTLCLSRTAGLEGAADAWRFQVTLLEYLEKAWDQPDHGIWETRGDKRHFTHSKVMAWVAFDRALEDMTKHGLPGPAARWRKLRAHIHADICRKGYDPSRKCFVQYYGGKEVDASLLLIPQVGFLPARDPRVRGTIAAIEQDLVVDGLVLRYRTLPGRERAPPHEGTFLPCSFWLADALVLSGRKAEATRLFERLAALANDVGLLAEEYEPRRKRMLGNFPQALSHMALVNTALNLTRDAGPAAHRSRQSKARGRA
ncbi:MAG: glycoside hydrolase family 15 protein [Burkholderiales bacterium]|nr:glycoside hydrolase family 15 protein [Burkholderiales bacterium]